MYIEMEMKITVLNNGKKFRIKVFYCKFELRQLGFQCVYELHN
jgi:hypothetical protein